MSVQVTDNEETGAVELTVDRESEGTVVTVYLTCKEASHLKQLLIARDQDYLDDLDQLTRGEK